MATVTTIDPSGGDDTTSIQNAINSATAQTYGGVVRLGEGLFSVTGLTMKTRVTLMGSGSATVIKLANASNTHVIQNNLNSDERYVIRDLVIDGNRSNQSAGAYDGIHIALSSSSSVFSAASAYGNVDPRHLYQNVLIRECKRYGMYYAGRGETHFTQLEIQRVDEHGFYLQSSDNFLVGVSVGGVGRMGVKDHGGGNHYSSCKVYFTGQNSSYTDGHGFYLDWGLSRNGYASCEAQDTWGHGWFIRGELCNLAACKVDAIGSLYPQHGMGSASVIDTAGIFFEDAHHNLVMGLTQMDRFASGSGPYAENVIRFDTNSDDNEIWARVWEGHITSDAVYFTSTQKNNRIILNGKVIGGFSVTPQRVGLLSNQSGSDFVPDLTQRNNGTIKIDTQGTISPPASPQKGQYLLSAFNSVAVTSPASLFANFDKRIGTFDKGVNGKNYIQILATEDPSDDSRTTLVNSVARTAVDVTSLS